MNHSLKLKMIAALMTAVLIMLLLGACSGGVAEEEAPAYDGVQYSIAKVEGEPDWSKVESEKPDYHRPEFFGRMEFEE